MRGLMMDVPLLVSSILTHAATWHSDTEIVSRSSDAGIHRSSYAELSRRSQKLAHALDRLGLADDERVGTLAWNGVRHLELYFGVSGSGRICHTINPRLFPEQIATVIEGAADAVLFVDPGLVGLLDMLADRLASVRAIVVLCEPDAMPVADHLPGLICYETFIAGESDHYAWPQFEEHRASGLCYTSATTGNPKGVLYSHRSTVLHAMTISMPDVFGFSARDTIMPVVPMFHVNAWGLPYGAAMAGSKLVMPGSKLDGASLHGLIRQEGVTATAGVPTVWTSLLDWVEARGETLAPLQRVGIGGSACPPVMIERFAALGVDVVHAWGMTETSPVAVANHPKNRQAALSPADRRALGRKQGRPLFGYEVRAASASGEDIAADGSAFGTMLVRGPCVAARYFGTDHDEAFAQEGWFATGDVVTVDPDGFIEIVDRTKDIIKSGGEWISSVTLENIALAHPAVREAAVVGRPDPRWGERPVLFVVTETGMNLDLEEMTSYFDGRVARWSVPSELRIVGDLPHTATGKLNKAAIRAML